MKPLNLRFLIINEVKEIMSILFLYLGKKVKTNALYSIVRITLCSSLVLERMRTDNG